MAGHRVRALEASITSRQNFSFTFRPKQKYVWNHLCTQAPILETAAPCQLQNLYSL